MESLSNIKEYYQYYLKTRSIVQVSKHFKKCTKYLAKWFKENQLEYPMPDFNRKEKLNARYFESIDSEVKAYLLGFFFADGGLYYRNRYKSGIEKVFNVRVSEEDREIVNLFAEQLEWTGKLPINKSADFVAPNGKTYNRKSQISISISSKELCTSLEKYGLSSRKTYNCVEIPEIISTLRPHFIRGYFDGDGCTSITDTHKVVSFTAKTECFLNSIKEELTGKKIKSSLTHERTRDVYVLRIQKKASIVDFYNYIYQNSSYFLHRKKCKFKNALIKLGELLGNPEAGNQQPSRT